MPAFIGVHYEFYVEYFNSVFALHYIYVVLHFFFILHFVVVTLSVTGIAAARRYWVGCVCVCVNVRFVRLVIAAVFHAFKTMLSKQFLNLKLIHAINQ